MPDTEVGKNAAEHIAVIMEEIRSAHRTITVHPSRVEELAAEVVAAQAETMITIVPHEWMPVDRIVIQQTFGYRNQFQDLMRAFTNG